LICYDISNGKRLRKVAKFLEKNAMRIQNSVFLYPQVVKFELTHLVNKLNELIDDEEDDIRIYHIDIKNSLSLRSGINLQEPTTIIGECDDI
jgi:CRISPR-associated protein Cas2